jgi:hypothetical protein
MARKKAPAPTACESVGADFTIELRRSPTMPAEYNTDAELLAKRLDELDASLTVMESQEHIDEEQYCATEDEFLNTLLELCKITGDEFKIFD